MKTKIFKIFFIATFILLVFSVFSFAETERIWNLTLGSRMPEVSLESQAILKFIELAEEKSQGKIVIIPYFGDILGSSTVQPENVSTGVQDMYVDSYSMCMHFIKDFRVHSIPYFFKDNEEYRKFLLSPIEKEMEQKFIDQYNIRVINENKNWLRGPYRVIIARNPILSIDDLKGLKLRQGDVPATIKTWSALGANTIIIPYNEAYLALKQGMVDAVTVPLENVYSGKFYEGAKHVTITHEYQQQLAIMMNEDTYQALPDELKHALIDAVNEAGDICTKSINESGAKRKDQLEKDHGVTFYEIDLEPWAKLSAEVHVALEEEGFLPKGLMKRIKDYLESD